MLRPGRCRVLSKFDRPPRVFSFFCFFFLLLLLIFFPFLFIAGVLVWYQLRPRKTLWLRVADYGLDQLQLDRFTRVVYERSYIVGSGMANLPICCAGSSVPSRPSGPYAPTPLLARMDGLTCVETSGSGSPSRFKTTGLAVTPLARRIRQAFAGKEAPQQAMRRPQT
jgi:hypothetical protein